MESLAVSDRYRAGVGGAGRHEFAVHLGGEVRQAAGHLAGAAQAGQAVQRGGGAGEVADLFAEVGRLFEAGPGGGEVGGGCRSPGPGLEQLGPDAGRQRNGEGVERGQCRVGLFGLSGHGQRVSG